MAEGWVRSGAVRCRNCPGVCVCVCVATTADAWPVFPIPPFPTRCIFLPGRSRRPNRRPLHHVGIYYVCAFCAQTWWRVEEGREEGERFLPVRCQSLAFLSFPFLSFPFSLHQSSLLPTFPLSASSVSLFQCLSVCRLLRAAIKLAAGRMLGVVRRDASKKKKKKKKKKKNLLHRNNAP